MNNLRSFRDLLAGGLSLLLFLGGPLSVLTSLPLTHLAMARGESRRAFQIAVVMIVLAAGAHYLPLEGWTAAADFLALSLPGYVLKEVRGMTAGLTVGLGYLAWLLVLGWIMASRRLPQRIEWRGGLWILVSCIAWFVIFEWGLKSPDVGFADFFTRSIHGLMDQILAAEPAAGLKADQLHFLEANRPLLEEGLLRILPGLFLAGVIGLAWIHAILIRVWGRFDLVVPPLPSTHPLVRPLSLWRVPDLMTWVVIAAGAFYFANAYLFRIKALRWILINLFLVLVLVYFLHGLGIVSFFLRRRFSPFVRGLAYAIIFLFFQTLGLIVMSLGFFDLWLDFRRLQSDTTSS